MWESLDEKNYKFKHIQFPQPFAFKAHQGNFRKNSELLKTMYML